MMSQTVCRQVVILRANKTSIKKNHIQINKVTSVASNAELQKLTEDGREPDLILAVAVALPLGGGTGMVVVGNPTPPGPILIVSFPITTVVGMAPIPIG